MKCFKRWKCRGIGSRSVLIILAWGFFLGFIVSSTIQKMFFLEDKQTTALHFSPLLCLFIFAATFPITSLLAEVYISRYKLVSYSLKAIWLLSVLYCITSIIKALIPYKYTTLVIIIEIYLIVFPRFFLLGAFLPGAVPLGIDQVIGGSAANISSFVIWLCWAIFFGLVVCQGVVLTILSHCSELSGININTILSLLSVFLLSVGLMLDFFFNHKLVKEPVTANPVTLIYRVLKYAVKHKYPVQRSAFTYCDDRRPTRLDYGKTKYGGPFTTEQVEDVKTFFRMVLVIFVIAISSVPLQAHYSATVEHYNKTSHDYPYKPQCTQNVIMEVTKSLPVIVYLIPIYELLVYPLLRHKSPGILKSGIIGSVALVVVSIYGIAVEIAYYLTYNGSLQCTFLSGIITSHKCFFIYIPSKALLGFASIVLFKCPIEFVCAQAPYNMKGFLIGLYFTLYVLFLAPGYGLYMIWKKYCYSYYTSGMCGIWFYLNVLVMAVVSLVLLGCVVRWYKARERDDINGSQNMVEEIYSKYQEQETN